MAGSISGVATRASIRAVRAAAQAFVLVILSWLFVPLAQAAESGIKLEVAQWVPTFTDSNGWWGVVHAGNKPREPVAKTNSADTLQLPPGSYDLYWVQGYDTSDQPMRLAAGVTVEAGKVTAVRADAGIKLDLADWVPPFTDSSGWWGVTVAGDAPKKSDAINWTKNPAAPLLLPPGSYDLYWVQGYDTSDQPMRLAAGVTVEAGKVTAVRADAGIRLKPAATAPAFGDSSGWWGAVPGGGAADKRVNWWKGRADAPLLLAPGSYDVFWRQDYSQEPERKVKSVAVAPGQLVEIDLSKGTSSEIASQPSNQDAAESQAAAADGQQGAKSSSAADTDMANTTAVDTGAAAAPSVVTWFRIRSKDGENTGSSFPEGIHEVEAWYDWENAEVGSPLGVKWYMDDRLILEEGEPVAAASGSTGWILKMSQGGALPDGNYRVELIENGQARQSLDFTIGKGSAAAPTPGTAPAAETMALLNQLLAGTPPGDVIDSNDFDNPVPGWSTTNDEGVKTGDAAGQYFIAMTGSHGWIFRGPPTVFSDSLFEIDATPAAESAGHPFGLFARYQDPGNFHGFVIGIDGSFAAFHAKDGQFGLDSAANAMLPPGTLNANGATNHLQLAASGTNLDFLVNGKLVATAKALWPQGQAGVLAGPSLKGAAVEIDYDNWRVRSLAALAPAGATSAASPEIDSDGFSVPSLEGFKKKQTMQMDLSPAVEGKESIVEAFVGPNGDTISRMLTGDVLWGYGWMPNGDANKGYVLRDPACSGNFTEKWAPTVPFSAPDCAIGQKRSEAPAVGNASLADYTPQDPNAAIKEVSLGYTDADEDGFDPKRRGTRFPQGVTRVVVWFRYAAEPGRTLISRWYLENELLYESSPLQPTEPAGSSFWGFADSGMRPLPIGNYRVELLEDGRVATAIPFQIDARDTSATPWAGRGWTPGENGGFVNDRYGLRLTVPKNWVVGNELKFDVRLLWVMAKFDANGREKLTVSIMRLRNSQWSSSEGFFDDQLKTLKASTITVDGSTKPFTDVIRAGRVGDSDLYEVEHVMTNGHARSHQFYFLRNGIAYIVTLKAEADASDDELAELDAVRKSMGL
ncbi:MAG: hypothetical protein ACOY3L_18555 [Pseudomonadota bacterium]